MKENETISKGWNWVEVYVKNETEETVLEIKGKISQETLPILMQLTGLGYVPPPLIPTPFVVRVTCEHRNICTETSEKCADCDNNEAKSYFTPKE